jgi:hypothetical protein
MPKGGRREGSGRPLGSKNVRHRVKVPNNDELMPVEWMLAVLRDPLTEESRRDRMAEIAAPYLHPRLQAATITTHGNGRNYSGGDVTFVQILSVPHRGRISDDGMVVVDGEPVTELAAITPYEGTPGLLTDQSEQPAPPVERLPIIEMDEPENVTRLDQFKAKRDEP